MSVHSSTPSERITVPKLVSKKAARERIVALTAYDTPTAALLDESGVDLILVGDSLGMVVLGEATTLPVTLDVMIHHARAVSRGAQRSLLVGDLPFLSYHTTPSRAVKNAGRFIQEGGMQAVKLEGGKKRLPMVRAILDAEIPVLGHLGLTPQSVHALGGFKVQAKSEKEAERLIADAVALEAEGAFAIVLECVPGDVASRVTREIGIPTIGIGAGVGCDGQILVFHDALGWDTGHRRPRFVRRFAELRAEAKRGVEAYAAAVKDGSFPAAEESFGPAADLVRAGSKSEKKS